MRIVSLNTWKNEGDYRRRIALMTEGLARLKPDVVCLQECFAAPFADTAAALAAALGLQAHARPARRKPRPHGGDLVVSTSGLAILVRGPVLAEAVIPLSGDARDGERIAQRVDVAAGGEALRVLNLHLTHLRGEAAARLRAVQLAEALDWAGAGWDGPLVVAGDLNARAEDPELAAVAAYAPAGSPSTLHASATAAIDHCLLLPPNGWRLRRRFLALTEADADGLRASDHAAVVADVTPPA